ncbi:MAG: hypothetical protein AB7Q17_13275 [Phycisphaerae bacterium]
MIATGTAALATFWPGWSSAVVGFLVALGVIVVLMLAAVLVAQLCDALRLARFRRRHRGRVLLVWSSRAGWHDVMRNNVLPAAPPDLVAIHEPSSGFGHAPDSIPISARWTLDGTRRPFLAYFDGRKLRAVSLNRRLQPHKLARRDLPTQRAIGEVLADAMRAARGSAAR